MNGENNGGNKSKRKAIDPKVFIAAWESSQTIGDVATKTGLTQASCVSKAAAFRKKYGVGLKSLGKGGPRGAKKLNTADLQSFLVELRSNTVDSPEVPDPVVTNNTDTKAETEELTAVG